MNARHSLTLGPENEPLGVRLYVHQIDEKWAAMTLADDMPAPGPGELKGTVFFAGTAKEAERAAKTYLGVSEPGN